MNEDDKRTIIDSYDGDPEDLVFFQDPVASKEEDAEEIYAEDIYAENSFTEEIDTADEPETAVQMATGNVAGTTEQLKAQEKRPEIQAFDINDPHYENYEPDLYYEYGHGTEPEPIGMPDGKGKEGMGLGTTSMVTGICSILFGCCGFQYVLSVAALATGIACLVGKRRSGTAKSFATVGIVCGALALLGGILQVVVLTSASILPDILQYFVIG